MAIKNKVIKGIKNLKNVKFFGNIKSKFKLKTRDERNEDKIVSLRDQLIELEEKLDNETNIFNRKRIAAKLDTIENQLNRKVEEREIREKIKSEAASGWQEKQDEYDKIQEDLDELVRQREDLEYELQVPYEALAKFEEKENNKFEDNSKMDELRRNRDKIFGNREEFKDSKEENDSNSVKPDATISVKNTDGQVIKLTKAEYQDMALRIEQVLEDIDVAISDKENKLDENFEFLKKGFAKDFKEKMSTAMKPYKENIFKRMYNNTIGTWVQGFKDWRSNRQEAKKEIEEAKQQIAEKREQELKDQEIERKESRRKNLEKMGLFVEKDELGNHDEKDQNKEEEKVKDENEDREP